jgi:hypothetical protein
MTDEKKPGDEPEGPRGRPPSASAAAARRARRIGGRPVTSAGSRAAASPPAEEPVKPPEPVAKKPVKVKKEPVTEQPVAQRADKDVGAASEPPAPARAPAPNWLNWAPAAVLSVGALVMAVLILVFSHGVWWGPDPGKPVSAASANVIRERVLAAAKTCVAATNTYKYTDLDTYEAKALDCATGEFVGQLKTTIETLIKVNAPKLKSSQTAQINKGGVEAVTSNGKQWTILLFGQLTVVNTNDPKGRTDPFGAQVRMEKVKGEWLISGLTTVSTPLS